MKDMRNLDSNRKKRKLKLVIKICLVTFMINNSSLISQDISTVGEIYDFEIGDIFHYENRDYVVYLTNSIIEITGKYYSENNDTLYYIRNYQNASCYTFDSIWSFSSGIDTIKFFDLESQINEGIISYTTIEPSMYNGRLINVYTPCECEFLFFVVGCGLAWDNFYDQDEMILVRNHSIVFFKKGEEEWGTPLTIFTGIQLSEINPEISIFPNPVLNSTNIDLTNCNENFNRANILSISGNIIESVLIENHMINQINLSKLVNGIYIIELNSSDNKYYRKIIKQ
jgi:hypothetical protein